MVYKGDWSFLKNSYQMLFKKGQKYLMSFLKFFEKPLKKFYNFMLSFLTFFYSTLYCIKHFACFGLIVILFESISFQVHFKIIYIFVHINVFACVIFWKHFKSKDIKWPRRWCQVWLRDEIKYLISTMGSVWKKKSKKY